MQSAAASSIAGRENRGSMQYQEQQRNERKKNKENPSRATNLEPIEGPKKTTPFPPLEALPAAAPAEKRIQLSPGTKTKPIRTSGRCERASKIGSGRSAHHRGGERNGRAPLAARGRRVDAAALRGSRRRRRRRLGGWVAGGAGGGG